MNHLPATGNLGRIELCKHVQGLFLARFQKDLTAFSNIPNTSKKPQVSKALSLRISPSSCQAVAG